MSTLYTKPLEFVQNATEWSTEDESLLELRGKSHFARTLYPMSEDTQKAWEALNYFLAIFGILVIWGLQKRRETNALSSYKKMLSTKFN
jgi:ABC-2 type transport system permease protein